MTAQHAVPQEEQIVILEFVIVRKAVNLYSLPKFQGKKKAAGNQKSDGSNKFRHLTKSAYPFIKE